MYIRYWKSVEILNGKEIWGIWAEVYWRQSISLFTQSYALCKIEFHDLEFWKMKVFVVVFNFLNLVLKKYGKGFLKTCGNPGWREQCCPRVRGKSSFREWSTSVLSNLFWNCGRVNAWQFDRGPGVLHDVPALLLHARNSASIGGINQSYARKQVVSPPVPAYTL